MEDDRREFTRFVFDKDEIQIFSDDAMCRESEFITKP